jgi:thioredoxin reductase (NADPH)
VVTVAGGIEVRSRAVVIATGVSYRRLGIPSLDALTGAGVFYGAATSEATAMKGREVFVVGGANSAGQAAVHLARYAAKVTMLVRDQSLAESMSEYLVKEITGTPNIAVRHDTAVMGGTGTGRLESLTLLDQMSGVTETVPAAAVFVMIGAEPRTQWLPEDIRRDQWGSWSPGPTSWRAGTLRTAGRSSALPCFWSPACLGSSRSATSAAGR